MFKLKAFLVPTLAACTLAFAAQTCAQTQNHSQDKQDKMDITQPKPVENKLLDSMVGTWVSENNMLGGKTESELKVRWAVNHQYLIMHLEAKGVDNSNLKYEGLGILGLSGKGNVKAWWFDSWGADAVNTGTGKFNGNSLVLNNSGEMFSENRTIEVKGDEMKMHAKGIMTLEKGKKTNFDEIVVYKKK
jgi:hypothetical protein